MSSEMDTVNASESSAMTNKSTVGSAPRLMTGFSIESILAKPDRISNNQLPNMDSINRTVDIINSSNKNEFGQMCNEFRSSVLRGTNKSFDHPTSNHGLSVDGSLDGCSGFSFSDQQLHRNELSCTTPDSSCVDDPTNMIGSDDGDLSEESGCK